MQTGLEMLPPSRRWLLIVVRCVPFSGSPRVCWDLPHSSSHPPILSYIWERGGCPLVPGPLPGGEVRGLVVEATCPCLWRSSLAATRVKGSVTTLTSHPTWPLIHLHHLSGYTVRGIVSLLMPALLVLFERGVEATPFDFPTLALVGAIVQIKVGVKRKKNPRC